MADACAVLMVAGLAAYVIFAGADFGGGFWDLTAGGAEKGGPVRGLIQRSMKPIWEANHVWLIFVFVLFWTAFPVAYASAFSTLYVPLSIAAIGIIFRGASFAFRGEAGTIKEARLLGGIFATSSILVPFAMGAAVGAVAIGRVPVGNAAGDPVTSWANPVGIGVGVMAVAITAYLSAVFLCADATEAERPDLQDAFRLRAIGAAVVAGVLAPAGLPVLRHYAPTLFHDLTHGWGLLLLIVSVGLGLFTFWLLTKRAFHLARYTAAGAVAGMIAAWAAAQYPYILPGQLTIQQAAAGKSTLEATLIASVIAVLILGPSLALLFKMVLSGTLYADYAPLDQRYRPLDTAEPPPVHA